MKTKLLPLGLSLAMTASLLAGCGGSGDGNASVQGLIRLLPRQLPEKQAAVPEIPEQQ